MTSWLSKFPFKTKAYLSTKSEQTKENIDNRLVIGQVSRSHGNGNRACWFSGCVTGPGTLLGPFLFEMHRSMSHRGLGKKKKKKKNPKLRI